MASKTKGLKMNGQEIGNLPKRKSLLPLFYKGGRKKKWKSALFGLHSHNGGKEKRGSSPLSKHKEGETRLISL